MDPLKMKVEETGERVIRKIQEWLLTESDSTGRGSLPKDTMQRLLVGVSTFPSDSITTLFLLFHLLNFCCDPFQACNQLELATHIEISASMLLQDVLEVAFDEGEEESNEALEAEEEEDDEEEDEEWLPPEEE